MIGHHQSMSSSQVNPKILNVLAKQQNELVAKPPDCVIFLPNQEGDVLDIQADIIGPVGTPYEGGVFRMKLIVDGEFPQKPPKGYFLTKIFHPNVAVPSGEICVNTLKKDWNPSNWSLSHIFEVVKCLLIVPFPESSLNEEAGREFMENYQDFFNNAMIHTSVHARPSAAQQKVIEQHMQIHYKAAQQEERKQEQSMYHQQHQFGQEATGGVLSQLTNSQFLGQSATSIEAKGGDMSMMMDGSMQQQQSKMQMPAAASLKKAPAAADPKKKWMRRI